jgi:non-ribosomal peptide synthetase component F
LLVDIQIISGVKLGAAVAALDLGTSWVPLVAGPTASSRAGTRQEECLVASQYITQTPAAYGFPLLIKGLLESGVTRAPEQEIVSANQNRLTYWQFAERVGRLASGLAGLGVERGDTVAIMDWDTHRYLECFFAVPIPQRAASPVTVCRSESSSWRLCELECNERFYLLRPPRRVSNEQPRAARGSDPVATTPPKLRHADQHNSGRARH